MWVAQKGFRDEELFVPRDYFMSLGFSVKVVSHTKGIAVSKFQMTVEVDSLDVETACSAKAFLLVGGPGTMDMEDDKLLHNVSQQAFSRGVLVGAICYAPNILAKAGLLADRMATVWNGPGLLEENGAKYLSTDVVEDGGIITACGPEAAQAWAEAISRFLGNRCQSISK